MHESKMYECVLKYINVRVKIYECVLKCMNMRAKCTNV